MSLPSHTAGICGSDIHATQGLFPLTAPRVMGHEYTGTVLAGGSSLGAMLALASRAQVTVSNDSGLAHLAAATGAPTVVVFGSTSSDEFHMMGAAHALGCPVARVRWLEPSGTVLGQPFFAMIHAGLLYPRSCCRCRSAWTSGSA